MLEIELRGEFTTQEIAVMNFGIIGFSTAQESVVLEHYKPRYRADVVSLVLFETSDFSDNVTYFGNGRYVPNYVIEGDSLILRDKPGATLRFFNFLRDI